MKSEKEVKEKLKHINNLDMNKDFEEGFFRMEREQRDAWIEALKWVLKKK